MNEFISALHDREAIAYSVREAAKRVNLSVAYLYLLMSRGDLRYTKIGKRRLIPHSALMDLIEGKS